MTAPNESSVAVEELLAQAKRLGLFPRYRIGTVFASVGCNNVSVMVTLDNDLAPSRTYNYVGSLTIGSRVLVLEIKPHGLYTIGATGCHDANPAVAGINQASVSDSTTSGTYVNLAGSTSFTYTKFRDDTRLEVDLRASSFITGSANTQPSFAAQIGGVDFEIVSMLINPLSTHTFMSGKGFVNVVAGTYTVQGRWRRVAGAGTLQRGADDWIALSVREVFVQ